MGRLRCRIWSGHFVLTIRLTYKGAVAGVIGGAVTDVVWLLTLTQKTNIYELLPGFIVGAICCVVVSLIDKAPGDEINALFDQAVSEEIE